MVLQKMALFHRGIDRSVFRGSHGRNPEKSHFGAFLGLGGGHFEKNGASKIGGDPPLGGSIGGPGKGPIRPWL